MERQGRKIKCIHRESQIENPEGKCTAGLGQSEGIFAPLRRGLSLRIGHTVRLQTAILGIIPVKHEDEQTEPSPPTTAMMSQA